MAQMQKLEGKRVAILATDGFEQSELLRPRAALKEAGAQVEVVSPRAGEIRGWNKTDWGETVPVDRKLDDARANDYDALMLPGGQINPDLLRIDEKAVSFVRDFMESAKPVAAICHAPWLLVEANVIDGRRLTSYRSIKTDVTNAGGDWVDEPVVVDRGLVTSRNPGDLDPFCAKMVEEFAEGSHAGR